MRSLPVHVWRKFQLAVMSLSEKSSLRDILGVIFSWIRADSKYFTVEPFSSYGFDKFLCLDENLMPVEYSSFLPGDIERFKKTILNYQPKETDFIARFLRDTVEALITVEVDRQCPRCESNAIRVFIGRHNGMLAYQCDVCGGANYSDGSRVEVGGLVFATEKQLQKFGVI